MPRNFSLNLKGLRMSDPRVAARAVVGTLLAANVAAALIAFHPWGGSAEDLQREQETLRGQLAGQRAALAKTRALAAKVERAREQGDKFLTQYITDRRETASIILDELNRTAKEAGVKQKPGDFTLEPVDGSDTLSQLTVSAAYEGTYSNLTKFVNLLDKSPRFLIIENMTASPQQSGQILNVSFKLDTFVRETPGGQS